MMRLTIIGFGNQAKSWALNLRDSGFPVRVALRGSSSSRALAQSEGLEVVELGTEDFFLDTVFALLTPDHTHKDFMDLHAAHLRPCSVILYAHGFSLLEHKFQENFPHIQHVLFAPKSIGSELRVQYLQKGKLGAVYSFEHFKGDPNETKKWLLNLATSLGINLGPFSTTFKHETEADLFSEQGLLCSLIPYAASEMFSQLVRKGIEPELAYFECWHELKLIINAMVDKGPRDFFGLISPNALIGSEKGYQTLFTDAFHQSLEKLLEDIQIGKFNKELADADLAATRRTIDERWRKTPLHETFVRINQDMK